MLARERLLSNSGQFYGRLASDSEATRSRQHHHNWDLHTGGDPEGKDDAREHASAGLTGFEAQRPEG
jgi:hypothetical protein